MRPIEILYEHPHWFQPLFSELQKRGVAHRLVHIDEHRYRPNAPPALASDHPLVFNRISPSAWKRGRAPAIYYAAGFIAHLEALGIPVFNGARCFQFETSKASQLSLLSNLGLAAPRAVVVHQPQQLIAAAEDLVFPLIAKPNVGGSGAGIVRFDDKAQLKAAVEEGRIVGGLDGIWLLQEYHRPRGESVVRVETLAGRYLYGIRVHLGDEGGFDLCPADICRTSRGEALEATAACPSRRRSAASPSRPIRRLLKSSPRSNASPKAPAWTSAESNTWSVNETVKPISTTSMRFPTSSPTGREWSASIRLRSWWMN